MQIYFATEEAKSLMKANFLLIVEAGDRAVNKKAEVRAQGFTAVRGHSKQIQQVCPRTGIGGTWIFTDLCISLFVVKNCRGLR